MFEGRGQKQVVAASDRPGRCPCPHRIAVQRWSMTWPPVLSDEWRSPGRWFSG